MNVINNKNSEEIYNEKISIDHNAVLEFTTDDTMRIPIKASDDSVGRVLKKSSKPNLNIFDQSHYFHKDEFIWTDVVIYKESTRVNCEVVKNEVDKHFKLSNYRLNKDYNRLFYLQKDKKIGLGLFAAQNIKKGWCLYKRSKFNLIKHINLSLLMYLT